MRTSQFLRLLDVYGADLSRWPREHEQQLLMPRPGRSSFRSSSLLKNLESGAFSVFLLGLRVGRSGCVRLLATVSRVVSGRVLRRQQFGNSDQIVSDQIEHEIGGDTGYAAMFGLAHRAVLLTPAEDAFGHRPARLRNAIAFVPRGASVDGALA